MRVRNGIFSRNLFMCVLMSKYYRRLVTLRIMRFFQARKSPAMMCFLASPTSQR